MSENVTPVGVIKSASVTPLIGSQSLYLPRQTYDKFLFYGQSSGVYIGEIWGVNRVISGQLLNEYRNNIYSTTYFVKNNGIKSIFWEQSNYNTYMLAIFSLTSHLVAGNLYNLTEPATNFTISKTDKTNQEKGLGNYTSVLGSYSPLSHFGMDWLAKKGHLYNYNLQVNTEGTTYTQISMYNKIGTTPVFTVKSQAKRLELNLSNLLHIGSVVYQSDNKKYYKLLSPTTNVESSWSEVLETAITTTVQTNSQRLALNISESIGIGSIVYVSSTGIYWKLVSPIPSLESSWVEIPHSRDILSYYEGYFLVDYENDKSYRINVNTSENDRTFTKVYTKYDTNTPYPTFSVGKPKYLEGGVGGLLLETQDDVGSNSVALLESFREFVHSNRTKYLKTRKGEIFPVFVYDYSESELDNAIKDQPYVGTFSFTQIGNSIGNTAEKD